MRTLKALMSTILLWFGAFLITFLCLTVVTTVVTGMSGIEHYQAMHFMYKSYCFISSVIATLSAVVFAYESRLIQTNTLLNKNENYDPNQIRLRFNE